MTQAQIPGILTATTNQQQPGINECITDIRHHLHRPGGHHAARGLRRLRVITSTDTTTLRAELPDQAALAGLIQRVNGLRLEIIHAQLLAPSPQDSN